MRIQLTLGFVTLIGVVVSAQAASVICPPPSRIEQSSSEGSGFSYSAKAPNGNLWRSDQAGTAEADLKAYAFAGASLDASKVACHYHGPGDAVLTLQLKTDDAAPGNQESWNNSACSSDKPTRCAFTLP